MEAPIDVAALSETHGRMILTTAMRILGDESAARDVLQTVFLEVLKLRPRKQAAVSRWGAWLRVAATRTALDALRKRGRFSGEAPTEDSLTAVDRGPHGVLEEREAAMRLRGYLRRLPDKEARVFVLRCFEELAYSEIAAHLGISESAVGVRLHRAKRKLEAMIAQARTRATPGAAVTEGGPSW